MDSRLDLKASGAIPLTNSNNISFVRGVYFIKRSKSMRKGTKLIQIKSAASAAKALTLSSLDLLIIAAIDAISFMVSSPRLFGIKLTVFI